VLLRGASSGSEREGKSAASSLGEGSSGYFSRVVRTTGLGSGSAGGGGSDGSAPQFQSKLLIAISLPFFFLSFLLL